MAKERAPRGIPTAPPPAPSSSPATAWRVLKSKSVSINGCLTTLVAGQLIAISTHGEDCILRIMQQGVQLEALP